MSASSSGNPSLYPAARSEVAYYIPGYRGQKIFMIFVGIVFMAYGLSQLKSPLFLLLGGSRTIAEVVRVIKTKDGLPDQVFTDDLHLKSAEEKRDRSYAFWNEFQFETPDGVNHLTRFSIGSQLKPLYPLLDDDGLPTSVQICYDANDIANICIPAVLSTWFAPGMITFLGAVCSLFGLILLHESQRKMEVL